jgi:hypothetical protein
MPEDQTQMPAAEQPSEAQINTPPFTTGPQPTNKSPYIGQMLLGFVSFFLLAGGIGWLVLILAVMSKSLPYPGLNMALPLLPIGLGVLVLARRFKRGPGLVAGFLIALGIVALAGGICASMLTLG